MKKVLKRTASIAIAAILSMSMLFAVHAMSDEAPIEDEVFTGGEIFFVEDLFDDEEFIRAMDEHLDSILGSGFMSNHRVGSALADRIEATFPRNECPIETMGGFTQFSYPDFFGGLYFNESGNLVVLIAASEAATRQANDIITMTASGGGIIREVEYSLSYLHSIWFPISNILLEQHGHPIASNIYSIGADIRRNMVTVELFEYSEEHINLFREFLGDSPAFEFSPAPPIGERFRWPGCISYPQALCGDSYKNEHLEDE